MWQKENVRKFLNEIISKNAFVNYDEKTKSYQIHKIFSQFLKDILESKSAEYKNLLYQRAANWYMTKGDFISAMQYYYLIRDFDSLLQALEADKGHSIYNEHKADFIHIYEDCPQYIKYRHPIALLVFALCLFSFNEMELFEKVCMEFNEAMEGDNGLDEKSQSELLGEFELLLSFTKYNDIQKMSVHIKDSWDLLKHPARFIDTKEGWTFGSPSVLYMFHREVGELENEVHKLKEAMPIYCQLAKEHGKGGEFVMEAEQYYYCGDFNNAEIKVHKALSLAKISEQEDIVICACFLQIRIAVATGNYSKAISIYHKLYEEIKNQKWNNLIYTLNLCEAFTISSIQQDKGVAKWIEEDDFHSSHLYFPTLAFLNIVYGRILLTKNEYLKLLGITDHFIEIASFYPNLLGMIYTYIYCAAANEKVNRRDAALAALSQALDIAIPDKLYMPFVENCDYIKVLLEEQYRLIGYNKHITNILELYKNYQSSIQRITQEHFTQKKPKLTDREMEIAQLVAAGMSNCEIGNQLFISQNTVKTLLKRIFEKLGINSRTMLKLYYDSQI
jgi:LuxR family maltose regulon positive regulatory protein